MAGRARPPPQPQPHSPSASTRRRERWLVVLGVALHAVYMLSIFDIYFKSPIVHGMAPEPPRFSAPPAKRLVLLVADGLRADKFFEPDERGRYRAPFLRGVIEGKGRWGVSHARPPTESRPGHVAIIAGFYEDPSAVTKGVPSHLSSNSAHFFMFNATRISVGWKANPVEFDSVFNQSRHTISFGSPDIVPIFCSSLPHSTWGTYPHEYEDFATDASFLDHWSFDQFQGLLNRSFEDAKLRQLLLQDKLVIFLHLLGCDTNGHAHRPYSNIYLNNVKVVDQIAESMYNLMESYFNDNQTAYVFTADHGMSDKGYTCGSAMPTEFCWKLTYALFEIKQVVYCSFGFAVYFPIISVQIDEVEAVLANTKQILNQFLRKSQMKQSSSLYFKPFKPLANYSLVLDQIEDLISAKDYENAMKHSEELRSMALAGLHYFQTYDWFMLMTTITLGYIGWMVNLILHVLQSYTSFPANLQKRTQVYAKNTSMKAVWRELSNMPFKYTMNLLNISVIALFILEFLVIFVAISSIMVWISTSHRSQNKQLDPLHQMINWLIAGFAMVLPLFSPSSVLSRLTSIFLGFAPPFLLLSIGYEAVFYSAFAMVLMGWIFVESANLYCSEQNGSARRSSVVEGSIFGYDERCLQLSDLRIPLLFTILFNVAFFGTGNFASIASFEISSVYRFITIFSPFLMAALLIFKLFIPFMLVICTFSAITKVVRIPRLGCYFLVILLSDVMTIHFFFLVRNTGSWMEIGNSISHFGIVSAQVVFVLLLFALTNIFTKDIEVSSRQLSSRKVM
uniref:GPI ethanolamine phosphate transferase 1 n=1 Tax=Oryza punctata TaxID=4537 RepID=A0A0E0K1K9_ORYPU